MSKRTRTSRWAAHHAAAIRDAATVLDAYTHLGRTGPSPAGCTGGLVIAATALARLF